MPADPAQSAPSAERWEGYDKCKGESCDLLILHSANNCYSLCENCLLAKVSQLTHSLEAERFASKSQSTRADTAESALRDAKKLERYRNESIHLEWSDRGGDFHPTEFWKAVCSCALDHSYDRTSNGVPYGMPDEYQAEFAPIVAKHLSQVEPNWKDATVYMTDEQRDAFEAELKVANESVRALLTVAAQTPEEK